MQQGEIFDIRRFAIHDGPGIRTTVFLKGCPLSCLWCHNPEGMRPGPNIWVKPERCIGCGTCVQVCPYGAPALQGNGKAAIDTNKCVFCDACVHACPANAIRRIDTCVSDEELVELLLQDELFYRVSGGGVTLSGGEPLQQTAFTQSVLEKVRARGVDTCLETCLYAPEAAVRAVMPYTDHFLADLKLMDDTLHKRYTGVSNAQIHDNLRLLAQNKKDVLIRVPLIPGITATEENLLAIARFVHGLDPSLKIELVNYNSLAGSKYALMGKSYFDNTLRAYPEERLEEFRRIVARPWARKGGSV